MTVNSPREDMIHDLRALWKEAFGDTDEYLDIFFNVAYSPDRCRCAMEDDRVAAALYILDCACDGEDIAYIYAVSTAETYRGRGLCRMLMADTEEYLKSLGYSGAILVPGSPGLFRMYEKMGYSVCSGIKEFTCEADSEACELREITTKEYGRLRRKLLPCRGVLQEDYSLKLLGENSKFYCGDGVLLAAHGEGDTLTVPELLGDASKAGAIVNSLGYKKGFFRTPGEEKNFAMFKGFREDATTPAYFGFAFDL